MGQVHSDMALHFGDNQAVLSRESLHVDNNGNGPADAAPHAGQKSYHRKAEYREMIELRVNP